MPARRQRRRRRVTRTNKGQRGGFFPLLALIPAAIAAGKAAALGAVSGAAGYGIKKALEGKTRKKHIPLRYPTAVQDFARRARREQRRLQAKKRA